MEKEWLRFNWIKRFPWTTRPAIFYFNIPGIGHPGIMIEILSHPITPAIPNYGQITGISEQIVDLTVYCKIWMTDTLMSPSPSFWSMLSSTYQWAGTWWDHLRRIGQSQFKGLATRLHWLNVGPQIADLVCKVIECKVRRTYRVISVKLHHSLLAIVKGDADARRGLGGIALHLLGCRQRRLAPHWRRQGLAGPWVWGTSVRW